MNLEGKTKEEIIETLQTTKKQERADEIKATQATTRVKLPSNGLINPNITEVTLKRMTTMQSKTLFTNNDPNFLTTLANTAKWQLSSSPKAMPAAGCSSSDRLLRQSKTIKPMLLLSQAAQLPESVSS